MKNLHIQKHPGFLRSAFASRSALTMVMLLVLTSWLHINGYAASTPPATPCSTYNIIMVKGTAGSDLFGPELLDLIGYRMGEGGRIEFEYSYEVRPGVTGVYSSPGHFSIKSLDAAGNILGHYVHANDPVDVFVSNDARYETTDEVGVMDHYAAGVIPQANGYRFLVLVRLTDSIDHDALTGSPIDYLNDLSRWPYAAFGIGIDVDANGKYVFAGGGNVTSLGAAVTPACTSIQPLKDAAIAFPGTAFRSEGNRNALLSRIAGIESAMAAGDNGGAIADLKDLRRKFDGCGVSADTNDWIIACPEQAQFRTSVDQLIVSLGGTP